MFAGFDGAFGWTGGESYAGTLFRLPLRTEEQAKTSKLSDRHHTAASLAPLLGDVAAQAAEMLLFLKAVERVAVYKWAPGAAKPELVHEAAIRDVTPQLRHLRAAPLRGPAPATADFALDIADGSDRQSWVVRGQMGGKTASVLAARAAARGDKLLPWAAVAARLDVAKPFDGRAYCFLPLPRKTGLKNVHVNGFFELSSNRRDLWAAGAEDERGGAADARGAWLCAWNAALLADVAAPCLGRALEAAANSPGAGALWPDATFFKRSRAPDAALWRVLGAAALADVRDTNRCCLRTATGKIVAPADAIVVPPPAGAFGDGPGVPADRPERDAVVAAPRTAASPSSPRRRRARGARARDGRVPEGRGVVRVVTARGFCEALAGGDAPRDRESGLALLRYACRHLGDDWAALDGCRLLPLNGGGFGVLAALPPSRPHLEAMGFSPAAVRSAVRASKGEEDGAVAALLSGEPPAFPAYFAPEARDLPLLPPRTAADIAACPENFPEPLLARLNGVGISPELAPDVARLCLAKGDGWATPWDADAAPAAESTFLDARAADGAVATLAALGEDLPVLPTADGVACTLAKGNPVVARGVDGFVEVLTRAGCVRAHACLELHDPGHALFSYVHDASTRRGALAALRAAPRGVAAGDAARALLAERRHAADDADAAQTARRLAIWPRFGGALGGLEGAVVLGWAPDECLAARGAPVAARRGGPPARGAEAADEPAAPADDAVEALDAPATRPARPRGPEDDAARLPWLADPPAPAPSAAAAVPRPRPPPPRHRRPLASARARLYGVLDASIRTDAASTAAILAGLGDGCPSVYVAAGATRFARPDDVAFAGGDVATAPYLHRVPPDLACFRHFLEAVGVRKRFGPADYAGVLQRLKQPDGAPLAQDDLDLALRLVFALGADASLTAEKCVDMDVVAPDEAGALRPCRELVFDDAPWLRDAKADFRVTHPTVAAPTRRSSARGPCGARSWTAGSRRARKRRRSSGTTWKPRPSGNGIADAAPRAHPAALPEGSGILNELVQNADDAGASEVRVLLDARSAATRGAQSLLSAGLAAWQGPALCVSNDAGFTESDWRNLVRVGQGSKLENFKTTGRFGLGFNSVYHLTDVPQVASGDHVLFLDPHADGLVPGATPQRPGLRVKFTGGADLPAAFPDQFASWADCGCDLEKPLEGTLFRLPLRSRAAAATSEISKQHYGVEEAEALLDQFKAQATSVLLFLRHVRAVTVTVRDGGESETVFRAAAREDPLGSPDVDGAAVLAGENPRASADDPLAALGGATKAEFYASPRDGGVAAAAPRRDVWHGEDMAGAGRLKSEWNVALLRDVVAVAYARLLLALGAAGADLWPLEAGAGPCWDACRAAVFDEARDLPLLTTDLDGGRAIEPKRCVAARAEDGAIADLLLLERLPVVALEPALHAALVASKCVGATARVLATPEGVAALCAYALADAPPTPPLPFNLTVDGSLGLGGDGPVVSVADPATPEFRILEAVVPGCWPTRPSRPLLAKLSDATRGAARRRAVGRAVAKARFDAPPGDVVAWDPPAAGAGSQAWVGDVWAWLAANDAQKPSRRRTRSRPARPPRRWRGDLGAAGRSPLALEVDVDVLANADLAAPLAAAIAPPTAPGVLRVLARAGDVDWPSDELCRNQIFNPTSIRIDFDLTELENSQVWSGPPKPVVGFGTGDEHPRALRDWLAEAAAAGGALDGLPEAKIFKVLGSHRHAARGGGAARRRRRRPLLNAAAPISTSSRRPGARALGRPRRAGRDGGARAPPVAAAPSARLAGAFSLSDCLFALNRDTLHVFDPSGAFLDDGGGEKRPPGRGRRYQLGDGDLMRKFPNQFEPFAHLPFGVSERGIAAGTILRLPLRGDFFVDGELDVTAASSELEAARRALLFGHALAGVTTHVFSGGNALLPRFSATRSGEKLLPRDGSGSASPARAAPAPRERPRVFRPPALLYEFRVVVATYDGDGGCASRADAWLALGVLAPSAALREAAAAARDRVGRDADAPLDRLPMRHALYRFWPRLAFGLGARAAGGDGRRRRRRRAASPSLAAEPLFLSGDGATYVAASGGLFRADPLPFRVEGFLQRRMALLRRPRVGRDLDAARDRWRATPAALRRALAAEDDGKLRGELAASGPDECWRLASQLLDLCCADAVAAADDGTARGREARQRCWAEVKHLPLIPLEDGSVAACRPRRRVFDGPATTAGAALLRPAIGALPGPRAPRRQGARCLGAAPALKWDRLDGAATTALLEELHPCATSPSLVATLRTLPLFKALGGDFAPLGEGDLEALSPRALDAVRPYAAPADLAGFLERPATAALRDLYADLRVPEVDVAAAAARVCAPRLKAGDLPPAVERDLVDFLVEHWDPELRRCQPSSTRSRARAHEALDAALVPAADCRSAPWLRLLRDLGLKRRVDATFLDAAKAAAAAADAGAARRLLKALYTDHALATDDGLLASLAPVAFVPCCDYARGGDVVDDFSSFDALVAPGDRRVAWLGAKVLRPGDAPPRVLWNPLGLRSPPAPATAQLKATLRSRELAGALAGLAAESGDGDGADADGLAAELSGFDVRYVSRLETAVALDAGAPAAAARRVAHVDGNGKVLYVAARPAAGVLSPAVARRRLRHLRLPPALAHGFGVLLNAPPKRLRASLALLAGDADGGAGADDASGGARARRGR
ncbi:hypothetical protein JL720_2576 [Aureococcus anophagefferens]|nr:hypothetical protein JL720_2576 [Aureococcus anophagefferens]